VTLMARHRLTPSTEQLSASPVPLTAMQPKMNSLELSHIDAASPVPLTAKQPKAPKLVQEVLSVPLAATQAVSQASDSSLLAMMQMRTQVAGPVPLAATQASLQVAGPEALTATQASSQVAEPVLLTARGPPLAFPNKSTS
jgi:hypothetical protein